MQTLRTNRPFWLAALVILAAGHSAALAYTVHGHAECPTAGWVPFGAVVKVFEVDPLPGGSYTIDATPLATATVDENGDFSVTFVWPSAGTGFELGGPDLIFCFIQNSDGAVETIYEENPLETHWNVMDDGPLSFSITSALAVCFNPALGPGSVPDNNHFLLTRIGVCETADIDCKGSDPSSEGYYRPRKAPYSFTGMNSDQPFGRTLHLMAWFGDDCNVEYYKVQYSTDDGITWHDIETSLPNKWYDDSDPNPLNWHWESESMGPFADGGLDNLYKIPYFVRPTKHWSWFDRVVRFNTILAADGLCRLKIAGYKWAAGSLVPVTSSDLFIDPNYGEIVLQIDNTAPTVEILDLKLNGVSKEVCKVLNFGTSPGDKIDVDFRVWDQKGHLRNYTLDAMYGHDCYVRPRPTTPDKAADNYDKNTSASPLWQGSMSNTTKYEGSVYGSGGATPATDCYSRTYAQMPANVMPTCAYQFRLHASKRTTNGYGLIYNWVEDTWHVTIQR